MYPDLNVDAWYNTLSAWYYQVDKRCLPVWLKGDLLEDRWQRMSFVNLSDDFAGRCSSGFGTVKVGNLSLKSFQVKGRASKVTVSVTNFETLS